MQHKFDAHMYLRDLLDGSKSHMTFNEVVADFPLNLINTSPPHTPYAPWHFLEHLRIAQWDILEFIRNPSHESPPFPQGFRPPAEQKATPESWNHSIAQYRRDLEDLREMAANPDTDLFAPIPHAPKYSIFRELLIVAEHNSYHIGEFALLRQVLNAWPEDRPYLTGTPEM